MLAIIDRNRQQRKCNGQLLFLFVMEVEPRPHRTFTSFRMDSAWLSTRTSLHLRHVLSLPRRSYCLAWPCLVVTSHSFNFQAFQGVLELLCCLQFRTEEISRLCCAIILASSPGRKAWMSYSLLRGVRLEPLLLQHTLDRYILESDRTRRVGISDSIECCVRP